MMSPGFRVAVACWLACQATFAMAAGVGVLLSEAGGVYAEVAEALVAELRPVSGAQATVGVAGETASRTLLARSPQVVVTVGARAAEQALNLPGGDFVVLCALLPRSAFETLMAGRANATRRVSALFLDQPVGRQLDLLRTALPRAGRLGAVLGPGSERELDRLRAAAEARGLRLVVERVERETELYAALQRTMGAADAFWAIPDARAINADSAQNLLLTSFRYRVPVLAYSAAYVDAGALLAVHSTPAQIGRETGEMVRAALRGELPPPRYPRLFSVAVNRGMARSLDLEIEPDAALGERLEK